MYATRHSMKSISWLTVVPALVPLVFSSAPRCQTLSLDGLAAISLDAGEGAAPEIRVQLSPGYPGARPDALGVHGAQSGRLPGTLSGGWQNTLVFKPQRALFPGEELEIALSKAGRTAAVVPSGTPTEVVARLRVPAGAGPAGFRSRRASVLARMSSAAAVGDLNGDGMLDLVAADGAGSREIRAHINTGGGALEPGPALMNGTRPGHEAARALALGDMDGDGDLDLVACFPLARNQIHYNDGRGGFPEMIEFGPLDDYAKSVALGDLDADGDLDIVTGCGDGGQRGRPNRVYLNEGKGQPAHAGSAGPDQSTEAVALGDINNDGSLDLVVANIAGHLNLVLLNDGRGKFRPGTSFGTRRNHCTAVALGDADGDGLLDIAVGNHAVFHNTLYLNRGDLHFEEVPIGPKPVGGTALAFGDMDGDGDLDLAVSESDYQHHVRAVYLNEGGRFDTARAVGPNARSGGALALGDLDGDGALDMVAGEDELTWYLNTDSPALSTTPTPIPAKPVVEQPTGERFAVQESHFIEANPSPTPTHTPTPVQAPEAAAAIVISASPVSLDFGETAAGGTAERTLTLTNESEYIVLGKVEAPQPFAIAEGGAFALLPGASSTVRVTYAPTSPEVHHADLFVTAGAELRIPLAGVANARE